MMQRTEEKRTATECAAESKAKRQKNRNLLGKGLGSGRI